MPRNRQNGPVAEYLVIVFFFGLATGIIGKGKGSSFWIWFLVGAVLPMLGLVAVILYRVEKNEPERQCPTCHKAAEALRPGLPPLRHRPVPAGPGGRPASGRAVEGPGRPRFELSRARYGRVAPDAARPKGRAVTDCISRASRTFESRATRPSATQVAGMAEGSGPTRKTQGGGLPSQGRVTRDTCERDGGSPLRECARSARKCNPIPARHRRAASSGAAREACATEFTGRGIHASLPHTYRSQVRTIALAKPTP